MNLLNFMSNFADEESCVTYLKEQRERRGVVCVMGKRDAQYSLDGQVELDDGFFTTERPEEEKDTPLKRGRGSQKKSKVVVMVESAPSQRYPRKGKPSKVVGHLKMQVIPDLKTQTVTDVAKKHLEPSVELTTDEDTAVGTYRHQQCQEIASGYAPQNQERVSTVLP